MSPRVRWLIGLSVLLAGCAVHPVTPSAVGDLGQVAASVAGPSGAELPATQIAVSGSAGPAETSDAGLAAGQPVVTQRPPAGPSSSLTNSVAAPESSAAASASPTPALIVVAEVPLVPVSTATASAVAVAVARANPAPTAVPPVSVAPPASGDVAAAEQYTVSLINAQRAALGLAPLAADPRLLDIANARVADMVARGYTGHNDPSTGVALGPAMMRAAGFTGLVGENWYGSRLGPPSIAEVAMKWFMTDPPHYHNILSVHYSGVGVGIAFNGQQWLLVQDFAGN